MDGDYIVNVESDSEYDSDDDYDPSCDMLEDARSEFSKLSVDKKGESRACEDSDSCDEGESIEVEVIVPELDEKDQKSFEIVQKLIEDGKVEKLKVDQCKVYLRKNGLRLTGNKETLIQRIKEHLVIIDGGGEKKYPPYSFVMNCKGDACIGDVVMFQQNVYEQFSLVSRSASGPPTGKRTVVGRIIKESYGAAKQQHTFTIEVLWSNGLKPLPPLHPLLIKGRNLYRFDTMRQKWKDESERQRILTEKHSRGALARSDREARLREKEWRKANRLARPKEKWIHQAQSSSTSIEKFDTDGAPKSGSFVTNSKPTVQPAALGSVGNLLVSARHPQHPVVLLHPQGIENQHHHASWGNPGISHSFPGRNEALHHNYRGSSVLSLRPYNFPATGDSSIIPTKDWQPPGNMNQYLMNRMQGRGEGPRRQLCRHFEKGRCYFGDNCKFLHEFRRDDLQRRQ